MTCFEPWDERADETPPDIYLAPTAIIDSDHPSVIAFMNAALDGDETSARQVAVKLYYKVRDGIWYFPYVPFHLAEHYRASNVIKRGNGYCVYKASLLCAVVEVLPAAERLPPSFVEALAGVGSDHQHARVLSVAFARPEIDAAEGEALLATTVDISSDHILADLLVEVAHTWKGTLPPSYFRALETVESDHTQRQAADAVLERRTLDRATAEGLLAALGLSTDSEMAEFLVSFLQVWPAGEELPAGFEDALATVGSSFEREKVAETLEQWRAADPTPGR